MVNDWQVIKNPCPMMLGGNIIEGDGRGPPLSR